MTLAGSGESLYDVRAMAPTVRAVEQKAECVVWGNLDGTDTRAGGVRRFDRGLIPTYLEDLGFVPALEMLARGSDRREELSVHRERTGEMGHPTPDLGGRSRSGEVGDAMVAPIGQLGSGQQDGPHRPLLPWVHHLTQHRELVDWLSSTCG